MRGTQRILNRSSWSKSFARPMNLILPRESTWDVIKTNSNALWLAIFDPISRTKYLDMINNNIIKDTVLGQATTGPFLTLALFHNLQNPLFEKYNLNTKEFVTAVGPALQVFHETLMKLGNDLPALLDAESQKQKQQEKEEETIDSVHDNNDNINTIDAINRLEELLFKSVLGPNLWREQATAQPESLAARLLKITTDDAFDAFFYSAKSVILRSPNRKHQIIVENCSLGEVALLKARVANVANSLNENSDNTNTIANSSDSDESSSTSTSTTQPAERIAAQMDVLYEITHTFKQPVMKPSPFNKNTTEPVIVASATAPVVEKENEQQEGEQKQEDESVEYETILTTTLGVAVFEGWLHGSPDGHDLRWKVALLRDANEFPHEPSISKI